MTWRGAASRDVVRVFSPLLREEEIDDAFREVYGLILAALAAHDLERERAGRRLRPNRD